MSNSFKKYIDKQIVKFLIKVKFGIPPHKCVNISSSQRMLNSRNLIKYFMKNYIKTYMDNYYNATVVIDNLSIRGKLHVVVSKSNVRPPLFEMWIDSTIGLQNDVVFLLNHLLLHGIFNWNYINKTLSKQINR